MVCCTGCDQRGKGKGASVQRQISIIMYPSYEETVQGLSYIEVGVVRGKGKGAAIQR